MMYDVQIFDLENTNKNNFLFWKKNENRELLEFLNVLDKVNENPHKIVLFNFYKFRNRNPKKSEEIERRIEEYNKQSSNFNKKIIHDFSFDVKKAKFISDFFINTPGQYGLRGDPELWSELELSFKNVVIPNTENELFEIITREIERITGNNLFGSEIFFVEKYYHGSGMSGGIVSSEWWIENGLPIIIARYKKIYG